MRFVKNPQPEGSKRPTGGSGRGRRSAPSRSRSSDRVDTGRKARTGRGARQALPGWRDLESGNRTERSPRSGLEGMLGTLPTVRVSLGILAVAGIVFTLIYIISPIDLIPDYILGIGQIDDAAILGFCLYLLRKDVRKYKEWLKESA